METMEQQRITLIAKAHNGMISIRTEIPVSDEPHTYVVTIDVTPQSVVETAAEQRLLDALYGVLADTPLPEISEEDRAPVLDERDAPSRSPRQTG